jgi:hypothetical protein
VRSKDTIPTPPFTLLSSDPSLSPTAPPRTKLALRETLLVDQEDTVRGARKGPDTVKERTAIATKASKAAATAKKREGKE